MSFKFQLDQLSNSKLLEVLNTFFKMDISVDGFEKEVFENLPFIILKTFKEGASIFISHKDKDIFQKFEAIKTFDLRREIKNLTNFVKFVDKSDNLLKDNIENILKNLFSNPKKEGFESTQEKKNFFSNNEAFLKPLIKSMKKIVNCLKQESKRDALKEIKLENLENIVKGALKENFKNLPKLVLSEHQTIKTLEKAIINFISKKQISENKLLKLEEQSTFGVIGYLEKKNKNNLKTRKKKKRKSVYEKEKDFEEEFKQIPF